MLQCKSCVVYPNWHFIMLNYIHFGNAECFTCNIMFCMLFGNGRDFLLQAAIIECSNEHCLLLLPTHGEIASDLGKLYQAHIDFVVDMCQPC